jgi:Cd2+/Zn2+-exporting ATPase
MVMFLFTVAELIEAKSLDRARNAISGLMQMTPERATVQQADGSWVEQEKHRARRDVRVRPASASAWTARSPPAVHHRSGADHRRKPAGGKTVGDKVFAGTINQAGSLEYRVTAAANNSTLARIIHAVEQAQGARAPTQRFVDSSRKSTPRWCSCWPWPWRHPAAVHGRAWFDWIYRALVLLVVACPCALVISTPVTIVSGLAAAARKGILIKGGVYLEGGRKLTSWPWTRPAPSPTANRCRPITCARARRRGRVRPWPPAWRRAPTTRCPGHRQRGCG